MKSRFFEFFRTKRLKLSLAIFFGTVGVISNYSALKYYIANTRIDLIGSEWTLTIYALGISIALDSAIVVFHLMRVYGLMWSSVLLAFLVSLTANTTTYLTCAGACKTYLDDWGAYLGFTQALMMSILPIVIIVYLTELAVNQYDSELEEIYKNSKQNIKFD